MIIYKGKSFREVPGYEGLYAISIDTKEGECLALHFKRGNTPTILKGWRQPDGRLYWDLNKDKKKK